MHIAIDGSPAINDIRAIKRYTYHLMSELSVIDIENPYTLLFMAYKPFISKFPDIRNNNFQIKKSLIPGKIIELFWHTFNWPNIDFWIKQNCDLFHFPGGYPYIPNTNKIFLTTLHGFACKYLPQHLNPIGYNDICNKLDYTISNSDHFITVSETNKKELMESWNVTESKITTIPLGISPEFHIYDLSEKQKQGLRNKYHFPDKKLILFVGALQPHKNIKNIIKAYNLLSYTQKEQYQLVLVGKETNYCKDYYSKIQSLGISDKVTFIDYISSGSLDLAYIYNIADIFLFPTFYEGWASPPLEAMKCGTPVIVSDIPSLKESTGNIALYCNPDEPEDISENIKKLINDPSLFETQKKKGMSFSSKYTWAQCAKLTYELYRKLAD